MALSSPTIVELADRLGVAAGDLARELTVRVQSEAALATLTADPFRSEQLPDLPEPLHPYDPVPARLLTS